MARERDDLHTNFTLPAHREHLTTSTPPNHKPRSLATANRAGVSFAERHTRFAGTAGHPASLTHPGVGEPHKQGYPK